MFCVTHCTIVDFCNDVAALENKVMILTHSAYRLVQPCFVCEL